MAPRPYVFLIPGFLGFAHINGLPYFRGVAEQLLATYAARGIAATVVRVETLPTSSLRRRAARLAEVIRDHAGADDRPIHLVAHSSGGLDARLLLTPRVSLPVDFDVEPLAARVRSLVTIATPHRGTPLASFFVGMFGQRVLWLASLCAAHMVRFGRVPVRVIGRLAALIRKPPGTAADAVVEDLSHELLDALPADNRGALLRMLDHIGDDQALLPQLTPDGVEPLVAVTDDRPTVRYGCVVALGPRPGLVPAIRIGLRGAAGASLATYSALHRLTSRMPANRMHGQSLEAVGQLQAAFGEPLTWRDNDGVVPTLSQPWGEIVAAVRADHLDMIGHFADPAVPSGQDWFASGSGFDARAFTTLWRAVGDFSLAEPVLVPLPIAAVASDRAVRRDLAVLGSLGFATAFVVYEWLRSLPIVAGSWSLCMLAFAAALTAGVGTALLVRRARETLGGRSVRRGLTPAATEPAIAVSPSTSAPDRPDPGPTRALAKRVAAPPT